MTFTNIYANQNSFRKSVMTEYNNSTDIERSATRELYNNPELQNFKTSDMKIVLIENLLLTKYYQKIKASCSKRKLTIEDNTKYRYRPEALSTDIYDTPGLWYLILKVNSCEDASEFHDLPYVLVPSIDTIRECLTNEEYILTKGSL